MKTIRLLAIFTLCALLVMLSGCGVPQSPSSGPQQQTTPPVPASAPAQTAAPSPADSGAAPTGAQATETSQEVDCNWSLEVNDTKTAKVNGYDFTCTLTISAVKAGGKDDMGIYKGTASLKYEYNMEKGNVSGNAAGSGQASDAQFELIAYDTQKYSDLTPSAPLAPLVTYDSMAFGSLNFIGSGLSQENSGGAAWSTSDSKAVAVPYRMVIVGGQVTIELYSLAPAMFFSGTVTGTPAG